MANILRTQLKKSLNVKKRPIGINKRDSQKLGQNEAKIRPAFLKADKEVFNQDIDLEDFQEDAFEPEFPNLSPNPIEQSRFTIQHDPPVDPHISQEIENIVGDKFKLMVPNSKINKPKITPLNAFQRVKEYQERNGVSDQKLYDPSFHPFGLHKSKSIRAYELFGSPSDSSKVYATPDMPMAKSEYSIKGSITELQMCMKLAVQTLPVFKGQFFQLDYFPPEHILSHFRKSRPALKVQYKDGYVFNDIEFDKKYKHKQATFNKSYYPRDYAYIRWYWRRLIKKEFFKAYKDLKGLDGFYIFRVRFFPKEEHLEAFKKEIKEGVISAKIKEHNCLKVTKKHNLMIDAQTIDNTIKMNNLPPLTLLPGVQLRQRTSRSPLKNIIQSPGPSSRLSGTMSRGKTSPQTSEETRKVISDILNFYIDDDTSTTEGSTDKWSVAQEQQNKKYDEAIKIIESGNTKNFSPKIKELLKHLKY